MLLVPYKDYVRDIQNVLGNIQQTETKGYLSASLSLG